MGLLAGAHRGGGAGLGEPGLHGAFAGCSCIALERGLSGELRDGRNFRAVGCGLSAGWRGGAGETNKPQWVYAEVDYLIAKVRASGGVQTYKHWPEQPGAGALPKAQVVDISGAKQ